MEEFDILTSVKDTLGITGDYQDTTLLNYINEVKEFMLDAGVKKEIVESKSSSGLVARGVADLWNYGSGKADLSPYFMKRVIQLCYKKTGGKSHGRI